MIQEIGGTIHPENGYIVISVTEFGPEFYYEKSLGGNDLILIFSTRNYNQFFEKLLEINEIFEFFKITESKNGRYEFSFILIFQLFKFLMSKEQLFVIRNNLTSKYARIIKNDEYVTNSSNLLILTTTLKNKDTDNLFTFYIRQELKSNPKVQIFVKIENWDNFVTWSYESNKDFEKLYSYKDKPLMEGIIENLV